MKITTVIFSRNANRDLQFWTVLGSQGPNVSTTPITTMGCWQFLPLSVVQLKGKHWGKPHCHNGVVDMFGQGSKGKLTQHK